MNERMRYRTPNRLRLWRTEVGLSLDEVAGLTGVSKSMLSRIERGQRGVSAMMKVKIARRLDVPVSELFELEPLDEVAI